MRWKPPFRYLDHAAFLRLRDGGFVLAREVGLRFLSSLLFVYSLFVAVDALGDLISCDSCARSVFFFFGGGGGGAREL